jgi:hypothetical protein
MIKGINYTGKYISISGGNPVTNYINGQSGQQGLGNMRYNISSNNIEVWDGYVWQILSSSSANISLTSDAEEILDWAKNKKLEEEKILAMIKKHPGIKDIKEKLDVMMALVRESEKTE